MASLLAIADLVGAWPEDAHQAAVELSGNKDDDESINIQLLKDIRDHIVANNLDRLKTEELLDHLYSLEERPWNTFYRGREMNPRQLADRLKSFGINSKTIRFGSGTAKATCWKI